MNSFPLPSQLAYAIETQSGREYSSRKVGWGTSKLNTTNTVDRDDRGAASEPRITTAMSRCTLKPEDGEVVFKG